ncbi:MAG TPA: hypothetical protein VFN44_16705 [Solirubrobacteraceae bacterium]|nr:hypothetical protein [Solirubrobacteraceae bacterium]
MKRILFLAAVALMAFAGVAYAAGSITGKAIKDNTITGKDVKNKSLTPADFKGSVRGPAGPTGAAGPAGPAGPQGPAGPAAVSAVTVQSGGMTVPAGAVDGGTVSCPAGQRAIGGGFFSDSGIVFSSIATDDRSGWIVAVDNSDYAVPAELSGEVYCATAGQAVAAKVNPRASERQLERIISARRASK